MEENGLGELVAGKVKFKMEITLGSIITLVMLILSVLTWFIAGNIREQTMVEQFQEFKIFATNQFEQLTKKLEPLPVEIANQSSLMKRQDQTEIRVNDLQTNVNELDKRVTRDRVDINVLMQVKGGRL